MKKYLQRPLILFFMLLICMPVTVNAAAKIKLNKKNVTIVEGKTVALKLQRTKKKVKWSSQDKSIATVTKKGVVKGKKAGTTIIVAISDSKSYKCKITVKAKTPVPSLATNNITMYAGDIDCIEVNNYSGRLMCTSSDREVALVTNNGMILAKDYGTCVITVKAGKKVMKCIVNVTIPSPKCYPTSGQMFGKNYKVEEFSLTFVGYDPHYSTDGDNSDGRYTYYFPYKYRLKLKMKKVNDYEDDRMVGTIRFVFSGPNGYESIAGNNFVRTDPEENGDISVDTLVNFSQFGDRVFMN